MARPPFPDAVDQITPDWLNRSLEGGAATGLRAVRIGQDEGFSGCRLYRLMLDGGAGPASLVVKLSPADVTDARRMAGANAREVAFYAGHGQEAGLPLPFVHLARFDPATAASLLVMQDLGGHRALPFATGLGAGDAGLALRALAGLHARWWDGKGDAGPTLQQAYPFDTLWPAYRDHVARTMPDIALPPALRALGDRIAADPDAACARLTQGGPLTRIHGDAQADNLRFADGPGGPHALLLDWQFTGWGKGMSDVGYLMISSLTPALRRRHEAALVGGYRATLATRGVRGEDPGGYLRAAAGKLWITVAATLRYDNASPAKQRWRRVDLERLAAFCVDHAPAAAFG